MFPSRLLAGALLVGFAAVAACAAPSGDHDAVGSVDSELTEQGHIISDIGANDQKTGSYAGGGAQAFSFVAVAGDTITADVALIGGDALGWITDANFNVLASNDDGGAGSGDARVTFTVPSGGYRPFRIVFKDRTSPNGNYRVKLTTTPGTCNSSPGAESWHHYLFFSTAECAGVSHLPCSAPARAFRNNCGCGCEDPG